MGIDNQYEGYATFQLGICSRAWRKEISYDERSLWQDAGSPTGDGTFYSIDAPDNFDPDSPYQLVVGEQIYGVLENSKQSILHGESDFYNIGELLPGVYNLSVSQNAWSDTIDNSGWIDRAYLYRVTENDAGENFQTLIPFYSEETNGEIVGSSGPFSITFTLEAKDEFALNIIGAGPSTRGIQTPSIVHI